MPVASDAFFVGFGIAALAAILLTAFVLLRMAWRLLRGDEEIEPGGSWGRQFSSRGDDEED